MKKIKDNKKTKKLLVGVAVLLLLFLLILALELKGVINLYTRPGRSFIPEQTQNINFAPPTDSEKTAGNEAKKNLGEDEANNPQNDTASNGSFLKPTEVVITDAGQYDDIVEVRSFMPNYYEDGTCSIVFTKNQTKLERKTPAYKDASTTICTNPLIKTSDFSESGTWQVQVIYESISAKGESAKQNVVVQK